MRIDNLRNLAPKIVFFPGVELRTDKGDTNIHVILIFSNKSNLDDLYADFNSFKRTKGKNKEDEWKIYWDYNDIVEFAKSHEALISIHAGKKTNGVDDGISTYLPVNIAVKEEYYNTIDIYEMGQVGDFEQYKSHVFVGDKKEKPMIICSDCHNPNEYKSHLWIKADPTFEGLKQIINEPERVFVGDKPELLERIETTPTNFVKRLSINKTETSPIEDIWYDNINIDFNPGLVAIIGNKGSGKSAITDIIGLCADTRNDNWSFLTNNKFRKPKPHNLSKSFKAKITWQNNSASELKSLDSDVDKDKPERVKYIPQNFLETICTSEDDKNFEDEMKSIIFQYISDNEKLGKKSLDELIDYISTEIHNAEAIIKTKISDINKIIILLEEKKSPEYKARITGELNLKKEALEHIKSIRPKEVQKPNNENNDEKKKIQEAIETYRTNIDNVDVLIKQNQDKLNVISQTRQELVIAKEKLSQFIAEYESVVKELTPIFTKNSIKIEDVVKLTQNVKLIDDEITALDIQKNDISSRLLDEGEHNLLSKKEELEKLIKIEEDKLSGPDKVYQKYLSDLKTWQDKVNAIIGQDDINGTIKFFEKQIEYLKSNLDADILQAKNERKDLSISLIKKKREILTKYKELYRPIEVFIEDYKIDLESYPIELNASFVFESLTEKFFGMINQQVGGTFCGKDEGILKLKNQIQETDLDKDDSLYDFAVKINDMLAFDKRKIEPELKDINTQIKKGFSIHDVYDLLYCFDYINPVFKLKLAGKQLSELSPGERGALLLLFYLFIDMDDKPLIIDQPEENLDNESVYKYLVSFIKKAKNRRQVIIVTHNPNLAVVCDADQIIKMNIDKSNRNTVSFNSGSIEDPKINKCIVDILEGTYPAFHNRDSKYLKK